MSVNYNRTTINARLTDVLNQISSGTLQLLNSVGGVLASIPVSGLAVSSGVLTFGVATGSITSSGVAVAAQITSVSGVPVTGLTVSSASGSDILVNSATLNAGQLMTLTSGQIVGR